MDKKDISRLKKFLNKNNYLLKIFVVQGKKCIVKFPHNKYSSKHKQPLRNEYIINKTNGNHTIEKKSNRKTQKKNITCPSYATKLIIFADILTSCLEINYDVNLISFYDEEEKEISNDGAFTKIIPLESDSIKEKEMKLHALFLNYIKGDNGLEIKKLAKQHKILEGYESLISILEGD